MTTSEPPRLRSSPERRRSGLLLHLTSLPSPYGIGDLGNGADQFLDTLAGAGQAYWQMLPIGPTGYANSPYQSLSTFAANPLLISPDLLLADGLLEPADLHAPATLPTDRVDFGRVIRDKATVLEKAAQTFRTRADATARDRFGAFCDVHGDAWLHDYALYAALKVRHDLRPWHQWESGVALRAPAALDAARLELREPIETHQILQFLFFEQWERLRAAARRRRIALVGDLPLYVAHDSADVWANPDLFQLDSSGMPTVVAGVPPDYFSETGQRWGNPIYDWQSMEANGFPWWRARMRQLLSLFDLVRIDHFRGIAGYWEIPASESTAVRGRWLDGPGEALLAAIEADLGELPVIAEDLGVITSDVIALRTGHHLPGMRVAQFGFDAAPDSTIHDPSRFPVDVWGYTGTHDNDTTEGWFWGDNSGRDPRLVRGRRRELLELVGGGEVGWGLIELVAHSQAVTSVFPVQDVLGLGSEGRMNTPATTKDNWTWRLRDGQLTDDLVARLGDVTRAAGRTPAAPDD